MSTVVRTALLNDLPALLVLERSIPQAPHWSEAAYRDFMQQDRTALQQKTILVADADGHVQGFAAVSVLDEEAELESIVVAPTIRRSGQGRRLLAAAYTWALACGGKVLLLEVRESNAVARAFYAAEDFVVTGVRTHYYRDPDEGAVQMRRALTTAKGAVAASEEL